MLFPDYRPRRLRQNDAFRRMIRETSLGVDDLILPIFAIGGKNIKNPIPSMPGHFQLSIDHLIKTSQTAFELGIPAVMVFGIPDKKRKFPNKGRFAAGKAHRRDFCLMEQLPQNLFYFFDIHFPAAADRIDRTPTSGIAECAF